MKDLIHWDHPEDEHLIISTNLGIHTLRLDAAGLVDQNSLVSLDSIADLHEASLPKELQNISRKVLLIK